MKEIIKSYEYLYKIRQNKDNETGMHDATESIAWHTYLLKNKRGGYKEIMLGINFYAIYLKKQ